MYHQFKKEILNFDLYEKYKIDQSYEAYIHTYEKVTLELANQIEADLIQQHYKIFSVETLDNKDGSFDLIILLAKSKGFSF